MPQAMHVTGINRKSRNNLKFPDLTSGDERNWDEVSGTLGCSHDGRFLLDFDEKDAWLNILGIPRNVKSSLEFWTMMA